VPLPWRCLWHPKTRTAGFHQGLFDETQKGPPGGENIWFSRTIVTIGSEYCNMNFNVGWGMMISWHMTTWFSQDWCSSQPAHGHALWLCARWCRNSLSRCRTRRHQTVHAWVLWPVWHCWQSSEKAREAVKYREVVKGGAQYLKFWEAAIIRTYELIINSLPSLSFIVHHCHYGILWNMLEYP